MDDRKLLFALGGVIAALIIGIAAFAIFGNLGGDNDTVKDKDVLGKNSPALASDAAKQVDKAKRKAVNTYLRKKKGFDRSDYCFRICAKHVVDRQPGAVAEEALLTNEDLAQWLTSNSERAKATRERAKRVLSKRNYHRFLTGKDHVRVQFKIPIAYTQNSAYADGQVVLVTGSRAVSKGDLLFVFVEKRKNGKGYKANGDGNVRPDCGNIHAVPAKIGPPSKRPPPKQPPPPSKPPTEVPPTEERHPVVTDDDIGRDDPRPVSEGAEHGSTHRPVKEGNTNPPPKGTATGGDQGGGVGGSNEGPASGTDSTGATNPGEPAGPVEDTGQGSTGEVPTGESEEPAW